MCILFTYNNYQFHLNKSVSFNEALALNLWYRIMSNDNNQLEKREKTIHIYLYLSTYQSKGVKRIILLFIYKKTV